MGALPYEVFEPLPCLVEGLRILLGKRCDVRPQLGGLVSWEVLAEECLGESLLGGE